MNTNMVKPEKFGHLHLVYHLTVPLKYFFASWRIKFAMILRIVSLKIEICLFTLLLEKALSQLNQDMDCWIRSLFAY